MQDDHGISAHIQFTDVDEPDLVGNYADVRHEGNFVILLYVEEEKLCATSFPSHAIKRMDISQALS